MAVKLLFLYRLGTQVFDVCAFTSAHLLSVLSI